MDAIADYQRVGRVLSKLLKKAGPAFPPAYSCDSYCRDDQRAAFTDVAKRHGFERLGTGHFAVVFKHPKWPGIAFKCGLAKEDSGSAYAAWARANPGPHVPRILFMARHSNMYFVVMPEYAGYYKKEDGPMYAVQDVLYGEGSDGSPLQDTAAAIRKFFDGVADFDLHGGNVMWDGDNLVITDPVSFTKDYK